VSARQEGFTLVEVIVAMVLLAIVLTSLAGLSFAASATAIRNADDAAVRAHSLEVVNQYMTLPWNTVRNANTCTDAGGAGSVYRRCVTGVQSGRFATITVVVTPQQRRQRPDTVRFVRMQP
jgi:prepilin-type N-terminal cleavage/methylation domain-containing protein